MKRENIIRIMVGTLILLSLVLSVYHSQNWLFLTAFVGINLLQSGFTKFCPAEKILKSFNIGTE